MRLHVVDSTEHQATAKKAKKALKNDKNWRNLAIAGGVVAGLGKYGGDKSSDAKMLSGKLVDQQAI